jgi:transposase
VFGLGPATRIYLAAGVTDMRKGFEGLYGLVRDRLLCDPLSGHLFLFCNAQRNRLKVLVWDGSGLWGLCQKVRERPFQLAAVRRCAGQSRPNSGRALLIVGWNRPGANEEQALVPESVARRACRRINSLYVEIDSVK